MHHVSINGRVTRFERVSISARFNPVGGVYLFSRLSVGAPPTWLYVGKCQSFSERFATHERLGDIALAGANDLMVAVIHEEAERQMVERDLIHALHPLLNNQHADPTAIESMMARSRLRL